MSAKLLSDWWERGSRDVPPFLGVPGEEARSKCLRRLRGQPANGLGRGEEWRFPQLLPMLVSPRGNCPSEMPNRMLLPNAQAVVPVTARSVCPTSISVFHG